MNDQYSLQPKKNSLAVTSMVMGILGWVFTLIGLCINFVIVPFFTLATAGVGAALYICTCGPAALPPIFWIIGVIMGHVSKNRITESGEAGLGMAKAGMIMSYIGLGLGLLSVCVIVILSIFGVAIPGLSLPFLESIQY